MRKFGFLFLLLIIVFTFFSVFYLYYVPSNKESLNKYAFLSLHNIQAAIINKIEADKNLFKNNFQNPSNNSLDSFKKKLDISIIQSTRENNSFQPGNYQGKFVDVTDNNLVYLFSYNNDTIRFSRSVARSLKDILQAHQSDFFQSLLFLKLSGGQVVPAFKTDGLNIGSFAVTDSLLIGNKGGFYPGISDVHLGDLDYKIFYIPVDIDGQHFSLCGFKSAKEYRAGLNEIAPALVYPFVILLSLLLVVLPLIKLYSMGPGEKVTLRDFTGYFFSLFAGSMALTIIIIQVLLLKDTDIRQHNNLGRISRQINNAFQEELVRAYYQLQRLDSLAFRAQNQRIISQAIVNAMKEEHSNSNAYYNFDKVSWINQTGKQIIKGSLEDSVSLFLIDVSARNYYRDFLNNNCQRLPGNDTAIFSVEAVLTWVDGMFRFILAQRSKYPEAFISTVSANMYAVNHVIMPAGFGFSIIDQEGNVQVHSHENHNLNENFLNEVENAAQLKAAITSRQEHYVSEVKFYGKKHGVLITPIDRLPLFLVVFCDQDSTLGVNLRILLFTLLGCFIVFTTCMSIGMVIFWRRYHGRPMLFSPMDYLQWIIPRKKYGIIYISGFRFLFAYIIAIFLFVFLTNFYTPESNRSIFLLLLLSPFNITCGLLVIIKALTNTTGSYARNALMILTAVTVLVLWHCFRSGFTALVPVVVFQFMLLIFLTGIYFNRINLVRKKTGIWRAKYLIAYSLLIEFLVISLSVMPASLFTWYAHNQEFLNAARKEQLLLATSLDKRSNTIHDQLAMLNHTALPNDLFTTWQYSRGIYTIETTHIDTARKTLGHVAPDNAFDRFYFPIASFMGTDHTDLASFNGFRDALQGRLWHWTKPSGGYIDFFYTMHPDMRLSAKDNQTPPVISLHIRSKLPDRYIFLSSSFKLLLVITGVAILLLGLYQLIRRLSEDIFLQKFIRDSKDVPDKERRPPMIDAYYRHQWKSTEDKESMYQRLKKSMFDLTPFPAERLMNYAEHQSIDEARTWADYYAFILTRCSDREKYLLYNFALNGFLNYKNVPEIYHLLHQDILIAHDQEIRLFSRGFRAYILQHANDMLSQEKPFEKGSAWNSFKPLFMVLLFAAAAFLFLTQQEVWQRISALIAGIGTSLPLLFNLFRSDGKGAQAASNKG